MKIDTTPPATTSIDYELITDSILREASIQATTPNQSGAIDIVHKYEDSEQHDPTIAMLLTVKVREFGRLQYRRTLFGVHTFQIT